MAPLFGDARCTAAILEFLATTKVGVRGQVARPTAGADSEDDVQAEDDFQAEDVEAVFDPGGRAVERML
jgi:hypothetical protein